MTIGPTDLRTRALGPDLARGVMLLFIALANSHYFLQAPSVLGGFPQDTGAVDATVTWLIATFVDGRAFPMFGLLFGYGVAHVVRRQGGAARREVRHLLWRRALVLFSVGVLHGLLLYVGDILAAYGVLLLVGAWTVFWRDGWLLVGAAFFFALGCFPGPGSSSTSADPPDASMLPTDFLHQLVDRASVTWVIFLLGPLGFLCPFLLGLWAGRRRILERPTEHRALLTTVAAGGIAIAVMGAQPVALALFGVRPVPGSDVLDLIGPLHDATGILGGLGYAAAICLVAPHLRRGRLVEALAATGQRSMTCYLAQSVVWAVAFTPYLLGLSADLGVASTALLATLTWAVTVLLAARMARVGRRGPFEVLLRRVTYGRLAVA